jgi:hypothetical protein
VLQKFIANKNQRFLGPKIEDFEGIFERFLSVLKIRRDVYATIKIQI